MKNPKKNQWKHPHSDFLCLLFISSSSRLSDAGTTLLQEERSRWSLSVVDQVPTVGFHRHIEVALQCS